LPYWINKEILKLRSLLVKIAERLFSVCLWQIKIYTPSCQKSPSSPSKSPIGLSVNRPSDRNLLEKFKCQLYFFQYFHIWSPTTLIWYKNYSKMASLKFLSKLIVNAICYTVKITKQIIQIRTWDCSFTSCK
jgi:hypothetical protein